MKSKGQVNADRVCVLRASAVGSGELQSRKQGRTKVNKPMNCRTSFFPRLVLLPTVFDTLLLPSQAPYILS